MNEQKKTSEAVIVGDEEEVEKKGGVQWEMKRKM